MAAEHVENLRALTSGGGSLAASGYRLTGAIGQPPAGSVGHVGNDTLVSGLFAGSAGTSRSRVYLPGRMAPATALSGGGIVAVRSPRCG